MSKKLFCLVLMMGMAAPAWARSGRAILESYEGAKIPGNPVVGSEWSPGQVLTVGPESEAHVVYADGSQVFLSEGTQVRRTQDGYEMVTGEARTLVSKKAKAAGKDSGKYKFVVRAKSTVMGVRGTDFVVGLQQEQLNLNTLEGQVDAAPSMGDLVKGVNRVEIPAGMAITQSLGVAQGAAARVLPPPQAFNVASFKQTLVDRHPQMEAKIQKVMDRMPEVKRPELKAPEQLNPENNGAGELREQKGPSEGRGAGPKIEQPMQQRPPKFAPPLPTQMRPGPAAGMRPRMPERPPVLPPPAPVAPVIKPAPLPTANSLR